MMPPFLHSISALLAITIVGATARPPAEMVLIPGGCFDLGPRDQPMKDITRRVCLRSFFMDRSEVTVAAYNRCVRAGNCVGSKLLPFNKRQAAQQSSQFPVVGVYWWQALDFCRWAGKRLPTYDEWERAARGPQLTTHPWGDSPPTMKHVDLKRLDEPALGLRPVCTKPLGNSPEGLCDMADNATEYVATGSAWDSNGKAVMRNIESAADGKGMGKMVMGKLGSKYVREAWEFAVAGDDGPEPSGFIGFRCASNAPGPDAGPE